MAELAHLLAGFALSTPRAGDAAEVMRLSALDWAAVGLAGRAEPVAEILRELAMEEGGAPQATVIGASQRLPGRQACLVNGTISHALDYDDTHFAHIGHPSVAVIPAALAAAERAGARTKVFLTACLLGVEASVRVGVWLGRDHYQVGFHQTATAGAFGAAVAAGRLLGLGASEMEMALGLVSTRAAGLKSQFGTMGKPFNAGVAAQSGFEAVLLAGRGFASNPAALDGAQGFGPTHHGAADVSAFDRLGEIWHFTQVQHKFHACCHGLHATLEALKALDTGGQDIGQIIVHTHPRWMSVCNKVSPQTGLEAKFSYRMVIAMALCGLDTARLDSYTDAICADPGLRAICDKVHVVADDSLTEMQARVQINGTQAFHDLDLVPGLDQRRARVQAKAASLIGPDLSDQVWDVLSSDTQLSEFTNVLASGQGGTQ